MNQIILLQELEEMLADSHLAKDELLALREIIAGCDREEKNYLRNRSFELARKSINRDASSTFRTLKWLEQIVRIIDSQGQKQIVEGSASFSPGKECRRQIIDLCHQASTSIDVCVFTIADDRLTESLVSAHNRGIRLRVISDNDKSNDLGSDIDELQQRGVPVKMDRSSGHMHHKFAIFDQQYLLNGSFNWTRSASEYNHENMLLCSEPGPVRQFSREFESLWQEFS